MVTRRFEFYERSYGPISSYVKRRVRHDDGSDADVVAEIFIVAWRRLHDVPTHHKNCLGSTVSRETS